MARNTPTTNYGLLKPDPNDKVNTKGFWGIDQNTSFDLIDTQMKTNADAIISQTIKETSTAVTAGTMYQKSIRYSNGIQIEAGQLPMSGTASIYQDVAFIDSFDTNTSVNLSVGHHGITHYAVNYSPNYGTNTSLSNLKDGFRAALRSFNTTTSIPMLYCYVAVGTYV